MKILVCDLGRAVHLKASSASGEEPPWSILILDLHLVCSSKSMEEPFLTGICGSGFQALKFGCHLGSGPVWSLPTSFKCSLCSFVILSPKGGRNSEILVWRVVVRYLRKQEFRIQSSLPVGNKNLKDGEED